MEKIILSFTVLVGMMLLLIACASSPTIEQTAVPSPSPAPLHSPSPTLPSPVPQPVRFAPYEPVPVDVQPAVAPYTFDLQGITNRKVMTQLSPDARKLLESNGFVVVPAQYDQIYEVYKLASERGDPVFVTTGAALHAFHVLYDYALRLAEIEHFVTDLQRLDQTMLDAARAQVAATEGPVRESALRNVAYLSVALSLLDPSFQPPAAVSDRVSAELSQIEHHAGIAASPIFGYPEDYSQYVPRGHYTRNETFKRYFRAMMWHGRIGFRLQTPNPADAQRETRQAILLSHALGTEHVGKERALDVWDRIYEPTAFFVGKADDPTVRDYAAILRQVYGSDFQPSALADTTSLDRFIELARERRAPQIVSGLVTDQENPEQVTQGFRFMGQRFVPDSYVFQQLVYNRVGRYTGTGQPFTLSDSDAGPIRGLPRGLDVLSVLGSQRAADILQQEGDSDYVNYAQQLAKLQQVFRDLPAEQWTENLYWNWLYTLRPLLAEKENGYPAFMQTPAWTDKSLHTVLGSWTELRHDTILYAKQSYTLRATAMMPEKEPQMPKGYVEPEPEVFSRLAALARQMRVGLDQRGLLNEEYRNKLRRAEELFITLKTITEKELRNEALSRNEYQTIDSIGSRLDSLTTFSAEVQGEITSETDERMALIADVHTDTNMNRVLEEGVGDAFEIFVIAPVEGKPTVTTGSTFSYYEFSQPMKNRLTDEEWQRRRPKPDQPPWTASFIRKAR